MKKAVIVAYVAILAISFRQFAKSSPPIVWGIHLTTCTKPKRVTMQHMNVSRIEIPMRISIEESNKEPMFFEAMSFFFHFTYIYLAVKDQRINPLNMKTKDQQEFLRALFSMIAVFNLFLAICGIKELFTYLIVPFFFILISNAFLFVTYAWKHDKNAQFSNAVFCIGWVASLIYSTVVSFAGIESSLELNNPNQEASIFFTILGTAFAVGSVISVSRLMFLENNTTISIDESTVITELDPSEPTTVTV